MATGTVTFRGCSKSIRTDRATVVRQFQSYEASLNVLVISPLEVRGLSHSNHITPASGSERIR